MTITTGQIIQLLEQNDRDGIKQLIIETLRDNGVTIASEEAEIFSRMLTDGQNSQLLWAALGNEGLGVLVDVINDGAIPDLTDLSLLVSQNGERYDQLRGILNQNRDLLRSTIANWDYSALDDFFPNAAEKRLSVRDLAELGRDIALLPADVEGQGNLDVFIDLANGVVRHLDGSVAYDINAEEIEMVSTVVNNLIRGQSIEEAGVSQNIVDIALDVVRNLNIDDNSVKDRIIDLALDSSNALERATIETIKFLGYIDASAPLGREGDLDTQLMNIARERLQDAVQR